MAEFVLQSSLPTRHYAALETLVFFNTRQAEAQAGIARAVEAYGTPSILAGPDGLRVVVSRRADVQCLFALKMAGGGLQLAGMLMYLRVSREEIEVVHLGVVERWTGGRRGGLEVIAVLVRAVRAAAHRLRGVRRLSMTYLQGREFRLPLAPADRASVPRGRIADGDDAAVNDRLQT